jgi:hypothetical protein
VSLDRLVVYYPYVASVVGKKRGGSTYYYLVESARVGGKPRIVSQEYLGTAEELAAAMRGGGLGLPDRVQHKDFGVAAAAWGMLEDLGVAGLIDAAAGQAITLRAVEMSGLDCSSVALDMTNFATFIDTRNKRAPVAQRGKAKQKRSDLRLVGLGLVVTRDGGIPLTWHAYPGDKPDVTGLRPGRGRGGGGRHDRGVRRRAEQ